MRRLISSQWVAQHLVGPVYRPDRDRQDRGWRRPWRRRPAGTGTPSCTGPRPKLFRDLPMARADGSLGRLLESIARTDVLLVDDFAMAPLSEQERRDFLEICDDRYGRRSTILTSQLPVASWHAQIGDPTRGRQHSGPAGSQRLSH